MAGVETPDMLRGSERHGCDVNRACTMLFLLLLLLLWSTTAAALDTFHRVGVSTYGYGQLLAVARQILTVARYLLT